MKKDGRGYTLIELLVVIILMGLMTSLATYSIGKVFNVGVKVDAQQLTTALRSLRNETLTTKKEDLKMVLDKENDRYYFAFQNEGRIREKVYLKSYVKVSIEGKPLDEKCIFRFDTSTGALIGRGGTYVLEHKTTGRQVGVTLVEKTGSVMIDE